MMKPSVLVLSAFGIFAFYVCCADWLDDLLDGAFEAYLGSDCEEVAPFVSSVASGTDEFDRIVEQFSGSRTGGVVFWCVAAAVLASLTALLFAARFAVSDKIERLRGCRAEGCDPGASERDGGSIDDPCPRKSRRKSGETESVRLIWKGNEIFESSAHCSLRDEEKHREESQQSKMANVKDRGGGDDAEDVTPSSSNESTLHHMREIRRILESEPEAAKGFGSQERDAEFRRGFECGAAQGRDREAPQQNEKDEAETDGAERPRDATEREREAAADPKLMHRIRLLENKLRMEEMKNRSWISRMSRAEEILQQLNKQVERIEQDRTVETLTKTLRITSTVTNWMPMTPPGKSLQFTLSKIYYPRYPLPQQTSLSEIIKREVGLPFGEASRAQKSSPLPVLPPPLPLKQTPFEASLLRGNRTTNIAK